MNDDFVSKDEVAAVLDTWAEKKPPLPDIKIQPAAHVEFGVGMCQQIIVMLRRHALLCVKDPVLYIGRSLIFLMSNIYFALVYIKCRDRDQDQVLNRMWLCIWFIGVPANMGVVAVCMWTHLTFSPPVK